MSLTPPPLRSGSLPAQDFSHGGHGGGEAAPPKPPSQKLRFTHCVSGCGVGASETRFSAPIQIPSFHALRAWADGVLSAPNV